MLVLRVRRIDLRSVPVTIELTEENQTRYVKGLGWGRANGETGMSKSVSIAEKRGWEIGCKPGAKVELVHRRSHFVAFRRITQPSRTVADVLELARTAPQDELHALLGAIEEAKYILLARLQPQQPAPSSQPTSKPDRLLFSADEVAKMVGMPRRTIYEYAKRKGKPEYLPSVPFGSRVMFRLKDVEEWINRAAAARHDLAAVG